jgi:hypothetical protein
MRREVSYKCDLDQLREKTAAIAVSAAPMVRPKTCSDMVVLFHVHTPELRRHGQTGGILS